MHQEDDSLYIVAAQICSSHGIQGEIVCTCVDNLPFILEASMRVCVIPPQLGFDRFMTVEYVKEHKQSYLVGLSELRTKEDADKLSCNPHSCIMVSREELKNFGYDSEELIEGCAVRDYRGFEVYDDTKGFLGVVTELLSSGHQDLLCIETKEYGQVYIPYVEAYVKDCGTDKIIVSVPQSLLTLNA